MNKEELKQIILDNLVEANRVINEIVKDKKAILSFFTINDIVKDLKFNDLQLIESTFHKRTNYRYHVAYFRKDNLRARFKVICGNIELVDKTTEEGQKEIVNNVKKRWVKYVRKVYPEYIDLV
jgi:hypothetical protein